MSMSLPSIILILVLCFHSFHKLASHKNGPGDDGSSYRRSAAMEASDSLRFLVLGDWGGTPYYPYTTPAEVSLAKVMGNKAEDIGSSFTLALGDNFYDTGVRDVNDMRFTETFESVFTASSLQMPWYVVCGNHDHYGNCSAEIAYSKFSKRWTFPDFYYAKEFAIPGSNASVAILFIDTVILSGLTHPTDRSQPPPGPSSYSFASNEWDFIKQTLTTWSQSGKKDQWKLVVGHYPVWSVAEHGPTWELVSKLKPLLEEFGVSAYFCGHDHNMQHIQDGGVEYFVVGAGHLIDPSKKHEDDIPKDSLLFYYGPKNEGRYAGAFSAVTVTPTKMTVVFYNSTGNEIYTTNILKGN